MRVVEAFFSHQAVDPKKQKEIFTTWDDNDDGYNFLDTSIVPWMKYPSNRKIW